MPLLILVGIAWLVKAEVKKFEMKSDKKMAIVVTAILLISATGLINSASAADKYL